MNESIALFERFSGRTLDVRRHDEPVAGDQRRTKADTTRISSRARLGAARLARGRDRAAMGLGRRLVEGRSSRKRAKSAPIHKRTLSGPRRSRYRGGVVFPAC